MLKIVFLLSNYTINEKVTRYSIIDPMLKKAGWNLNDRSHILFEIPTENYDKTLINGFTDYTLYRENGEVLAVIEAKRTSRDAREGQKQVLNYVEWIEKNQTFRPFAFMSNGYEVFFWDTKDSAERQVAAFFSRENLEKLLFLKQNKKQISEIKIKDSIVKQSLSDRSYKENIRITGYKEKEKPCL